VKVTVAVPADQLEEVELFVHDPLTVHVSDPKAMYEDAAETVTLPVMLTTPDTDVSAPPERVSPAFAVKTFAPFASVPPDRVSSPLVVRGPRRVRVPVVTVTAPREAPAPKLRLPVPEKVTKEPVPVKLVAEDVSQLPVLMVMVADASVMVAAPLEVRSFAPKLTVAFVRVRVPLHVSGPLNVVETPGLTVRLFAVCARLTVPPEAITTKVDVPTSNVPRCVSMDVTVMVDPLAVSAPPATTLSAVALIARFETLVLKVVTAAPPPTVSVPAIVSPRAARVKVTVDGPELNVTLLNSFPLRLEPAKAMVWADEAPNTTVPLPGFQDPEVLTFVQVPAIAHDSDPKEMYDAADEMFTSPVTVTSPDEEVTAPPARVTLPFTVSVFVPLASIPPFTFNVLVVSGPPAVAVPVEIVKTLKAWEPPSAIVPEAVKVTTEVFALNTAPVAVDVQLPETVMRLPFAVNVPLVPRVTLPAVMANPAPEVWRTVFPVGDAVELRMRSAPPIHRPFAAIVYVTPAAAVVSNVRLLNSLPARLVPANVIAATEASLKRTVPVPADQRADVLEFVHVPPMVQVSEPNKMKDDGEEIVTLPLTVPAPDVDVRDPPESVIEVVDSVKVPFAKVPPDTVRLALTVALAARVEVPAVTVRLLNA